MAVSTLSFRVYVSQLSGRRLGAFKAAAAKLGITLDDYIGRVEAGQKCCLDCRTWKPRGDFGVDTSRWDATAAKCKSCVSVRWRDLHEFVPAEDLKKPGPPQSPLRDDEAERARGLINRDVAMDRRPSPNDLFCAKCGHKGGDRRHEYHHHMGYSAEHIYDVVALCSRCHHGEHPDAVAARVRHKDGTFAPNQE